MKPWSDRSPEVANLLNPAFCSLLIEEAIRGHVSATNNGLSWPLAFLILPMTLHRNTRENIPTSARSKLHVWTSANPEVRIGLLERVQRLYPYTKEGILFGVLHSALRIQDDGRLGLTGKRKKLHTPFEQQSEPYECVQKARTLGKLLGAAGSDSTTYAILTS